MNFEDSEEFKVVHQLLREARDLAGKAKSFTIDDPEEDLHEDKAVALAYAAACTAKYSTAQAIYTLHPEFPFNLSSLFSLFDEFVREILSSYGENHSQQQVLLDFDDIDFRYKELFPKD